MAKPPPGIQEEDEDGKENARPPVQNKNKKKNTTKWNGEEEDIEDNGDHIVAPLMEGRASDSINKSLSRYRFKK